MHRFTALLVGLLTVPTAASAFAEPDAVIAEQLDYAATLFEDDGLAPAGRLLPAHGVDGMLPLGGEVMLHLALSAGKRYVVIGACDRDCHDLDARVYGIANELLAEDTEPDDVPMLVFDATRSGSHLLQVSMPGCGTPKCGFGVRVFSD